jgi:polysaccharide biosynthesis protein PslG
MSRRSPLRKLLITVTAAAIITVIVNLIWETTPDMNGDAASPHRSSIVFGMADNALLGETAKVQASQLAAMRSIGITSVRVDANWSLVQPSGPMRFDWTTLDQEIRSIRSVGMSVDLIIDGCPPWAALGKSNYAFTQPALSTQYATWAADVARRYSVQGVTYFEIWNEPNIKLFWSPKPDPAAYTADLKAAYAAIKAVDPSALIIAGGLAPSSDSGHSYSPTSFLEAMYGDGAKGGFDAIAYHPYSYPLMPDTYEPGSGWSQMAETSPSVRSIMISNGDSNKPIWITEFGSPSNGPLGTLALSQRTQISEAIAYVKETNWVGAIYIYTWQDEASSPKGYKDFGLLTYNGLPKPVLFAVASALTNKPRPDSK